jgi:hypothetical protein
VSCCVYARARLQISERNRRGDRGEKNRAGVHGGKEVGKVKENYGEGKWLSDSTARLLKVCSVWLATGGGVRPGWMQAYFSGDVRPLCRWGPLLSLSLCFQLWATASCSDSVPREIV